MNFCQSCGMPLKNENDLGTNLNGSKNEDYCQYCFQKGQFTTDGTMDEMIEHCAQFVEAFNKDANVSFSKEEAIAQMKVFFPQLKRWRKPEKYFSTRQDWRKWLSEHFETATEVWFVFPQRSSGEKSLVYNDAVEEALCFEWIDSTIKYLDKDHKIQRFTPRKPGSSYSQANKERLKWLLDNKMVHPKFEAKIRDVLSKPFIFPDDIMDKLKEDSIAWENYQHFPDAYKRIRVAYIDAARKRPEEFARRLNHFVEKTKENKTVRGFGGIEKYY